MSEDARRLAELQRTSTALQRTIDALAQLETLDAFIPKVLHIVADVFGSPSAGFFEHPERLIYLRYWLLEGRILGPSDLPGLSGAEYDLLSRMAQGFTVPVEHLGVDPLKRSSPSVVHHAVTTASPEMHAFCRTMGWDWELNVPLLVGTRAEGALSLFRREHEPFSEEDIALAQELAKVIALAMKVSKVAVREREATAARERVAELAKANEALRMSLDRLADVPDPELFLGQVLQVAARQAGVELAHLWVHDDEGWVRLHLGYCNGEVFGPEAFHRMPLAEVYLRPFQVPGALIGGEALSQRTRPLVSDLFENPLYREMLTEAQLGIYRSLHAQTEVNVPLRFAGRCIAHLAVYLPPGRAVRDELVELVEALGHQATLAMELCRLAEEAREAAVARERDAGERERTIALRRANEALRRSTAQLVSFENLPQFLDVVLLEAIAAVGAVSGAVFIARPPDDALHTTAFVVRGEVVDVYRDPAYAMWRQPIPTQGQEFWQVVAKQREPWWLDYATPTPGDYEPAREWHLSVGHRFVVCMPMVSNDKVIGLFGLGYDKSVVVQPDPQRLELCEVLAQQATLAVRMADLSADSRRAAVLDERARLAREIHDGIVQNFIGIRMQLSKRQERQSDEHIARALKLTAQGLAEARRAVKALGPWRLTQQDFVSALGDMASAALSDGAPVDLKVSGEWGRLSQDIESHVFRIVQEAVNNVAKHANATAVTIELSFSPSQCSVLVTDNGIGFDLASAQGESSFGMFSIRQRAASIGADVEIVSRPGHGTQLLLSLPLKS